MEQMDSQWPFSNIAIHVIFLNNCAISLNMYHFSIKSLIIGGTARRGRGRGRPPGLKGKEIGLYYAKMGKERRQREDREQVYQLAVLTVKYCPKRYIQCYVMVQHSVGLF